MIPPFHSRLGDSRWSCGCGINQFGTTELNIRHMLRFRRFPFHETPACPPNPYRSTRIAGQAHSLDPPHTSLFPAEAHIFGWNIDSSMLNRLSVARPVRPGHLPALRWPRGTVNYGSLNLSPCGTRQIHVPGYFLPPVIFTGLLFALYTWKSFVMISLQNKIIYAPYLPPTARFEKIEDWHSKLLGIEWKEIHLRSIDGTDLALAVATVSPEVDESVEQSVSHHVYILYLQGRSLLRHRYLLCGSCANPELRKRLIFTTSLARSLLDTEEDQNKLQGKISWVRESSVHPGQFELSWVLDFCRVCKRDWYQPRHDRRCAMDISAARKYVLVFQERRAGYEADPVRLGAEHWSGFRFKSGSIW